jgi:hypothetical protein
MEAAGAWQWMMTFLLYGDVRRTAGGFFDAGGGVSYCFTNAADGYVKLIKAER